SGFVVIAGLLGMLTSLLTSLNERRREMAILRAMGARPNHIFFLLVSEATVLTTIGIALGTALLYSLLLIVQPFIQQQFGLYIEISGLTTYELLLLGIVQLAGIIVGVLPALRAYQHSLADGMTIKV
ncbi:ABC transporter permease, partial [Photobacterium sp. OFAV2-7]|uniref:ABC transporter permease n=1 Tax=Photobacterium sp. OFAV2-7 TaxID=2917748 RepID=UPI001EF470D4